MQYATVSYLFSAALPIAPQPAKRDTKAIGDRSELEAAVALARAGYIVAKPLADSYRYDLIIDDGHRLSRVQVKTGRLRGGVIRFNCFSSHTHRGGVSTRPYHGEVEYIAVYCPETGKTYLVPEATFVNAKMHLRVEPTLNRQDRRINWADEYALP